MKQNSKTAEKMSFTSSLMAIANKSLELYMQNLVWTNNTYTWVRCRKYCKLGDSATL
jgi:hypothetical protein